MDRRLNKLHNPLIKLLQENEGEKPKVSANERVYFQPPSNHVMHYPCFVYQLERGMSERADGKPYTIYDQYQVTYISRNPDNEELRSSMLYGFDHCSFETRIPIDGLYQDNFRVYI